MRLGFVALLVLYAGAANAADDLTVAIENVRVACGDISNELADMKTKTGINSAVTGIGTVSGGVALGTGIAKTGVDEEKQDLIARLNSEDLDTTLKQLVAKKQNITISKLDIQDEQEFKSSIHNAANSLIAVSNDEKKFNQLQEKSKSLGNWRTGTMAGAAATNIAGAVIAGTNKVKGDLKSQIDECINATKTLSRVKMQARMDDSADKFALQRADQIVSACSEWEYVDLSKIDKRATGALVSGAIGATTGIAGTVTSVSANAQDVHDGDATKEKNLNTASNVLAGATTVAGATATIFNATQIKAIKYAANVADVCEGALK